MSPKKVAILGGGIAGLTAAHELAGRGYEVAVFESTGRDAPSLGGKARSFERVDGGKRYFGEHGFRFFPGFYRHVIDTMRDIRLPSGRTVADNLHALPQTAFFAMQPERKDKLERSAPRRLVGAGFRHTGGAAIHVGVWLFLAWLLIGGWVVWYERQPPGIWAIWLSLPVAWFLVHTVAIVTKSPEDNAMKLDLPGERPESSRKVQCWLLTHHSVWRCVVIALAFGSLVWVEDPLRAVPIVLIVAAIAWWYPALATVRMLWGILQQIPAGIRPGVLESMAASLRIAAMVTSSPRRKYTQWERESWWSFIGAFRYSRPFQLAFATGLTRSFVATRAEKMSARTGASILAQLLYDLAPTLRDRSDADRILNAPTHDAWITPWFEQLERCPRVRFNTFVVNGQPIPLPKVEVVKLLTDQRKGPRGPRITGFEYLHEATGAAVPAPEIFDHYVVAVSGTAMQRILANSTEVVQADRTVQEVKLLGDPVGFTPTRRRGGRGESHHDGRSIPYLDGIFDLEFGWMTGMVYHLRHKVELPEAHLLCLESEWALTAIDVAPIWTRTAGVEQWGSIISVNVSDWFSPSPYALPARFETLDAVREEAWRQLRAHVPALEGIKAVPPFVPDRAINDPDPVALATKLPLLVGETTNAAALQNLPLTNSETLLVNTQGSWDKRPTAQTAFANLVIAGDYVRTWTDFASMESANEAAKRAVNVILERDRPWRTEHPKPCVIYELPIPHEVRGPVNAIATADRFIVRCGFPHPLMVLATPVGWFATLERVLRSASMRLRDVVEHPRAMHLRQLARASDSAAGAGDDEELGGIADEPVKPAA